MNINPRTSQTTLISNNPKASSNQLFSRSASSWFRGLAIIMVIASHYAEWWSWFTPSEGNVELFRTALTKLGEYGVAVFFLFSGYGLVKSIGSRRMNSHFIWKRILSTYIPYLAVVGVIELLSEGFTSTEDIWDYLSGHDYWFMVVLFILYIGFILIWSLTVNPHLRVILFAAFTAAYCWYLYQNGEHGFWYVSNPAFPLGIMLATYENSLPRIISRLRIVFLSLSAIGMAFFARFGLFPDTIASLTDDQKIWLQIGAVLVWTLLIVFAASAMRRCDPILIRLGKDSLYLYLTHTFIFMRCVNHFTEQSLTERFVISAVLTVVVSVSASLIVAAVTKLCGMLLEKLTSKTVESQKS